MGIECTLTQNWQTKAYLLSSMLQRKKPLNWLSLTIVTVFFGNPEHCHALDLILAQLEAIGLIPHVSYVNEVFGGVISHNEPRFSFEGVLQLSLDADLEKLAGLGVTLHFDAIYPHGEGLTDDYVQDLNRFSNIDAYDSLRLGELWAEKTFENLRIRVGQIAADRLFFISDQAALFLNSGFGTPSPVSLNFNLSIYPALGLGGYFEWTSPQQLHLKVALFDAMPGQEKTSNLHNLAFHWNPSAGVSALMELERSFPGHNGQQLGTLKAGCMWSRPNIEEDVRSFRHYGYLLYGIAERVLFAKRAEPDKELQGLGVFARACYSNGGAEITPLYIDAGLTCVGLLPGRDSDRLGIGFSYLRLNERYVNRETLPNHSEFVVETTYKAPIGSHFSVQPDLQYILQPGGRSGNALLLGVRFSFQF